jgi:exo-1,4-beta-D-glucosaminidase
MKALANLPKAKIQAEAHITSAEQKRVVALRLHNPSNALAFQIVAALRDAHGEDITPIVWSDNYLALMPGESRVISAQLPARTPENADVVISGWNIAEQTLHLAPR